MLQIIEDRRALHQIPELDRQLPETLAYLTAALAPLRCRLLRPMAGALCAYFDFGAAHTIAFRSDADALPVQEQTGLPFASHHPGKMHAAEYPAGLPARGGDDRWRTGPVPDGDLPGIRCRGDLRDAPVAGSAVGGHRQPQE